MSPSPLRHQLNHHSNTTNATTSATIKLTPKQGCFGLRALRGCLFRGVTAVMAVCHHRPPLPPPENFFGEPSDRNQKVFLSPDLLDPLLHAPLSLSHANHRRCYTTSTTPSTSYNHHLLHTPWQPRHHSPPLRPRPQSPPQPLTPRTTTTAVTPSPLSTPYHAISTPSLPYHQGSRGGIPRKSIIIVVVRVFVSGSNNNNNWKASKGKAFKVLDYIESRVLRDGFQGRNTIGNNTWVLADLPPGYKPLGCKWIFKRKLNVDGTIKNFKARLVIQGFRQKLGIYYFNTYALVARIKLLIALASTHNMIIHQRDVKIAFMNGELDEEENVELLMQGCSLTKQQLKEILFDQYERFRANGNKLIHDYFVQFHKLINDIKITKIQILAHQRNTKFLNNLPSYWSKYVTNCEEQSGHIKWNSDLLAYMAQATKTSSHTSSQQYSPLQYVPPQPHYTPLPQQSPQSTNDAMLATMNQIVKLLSGQITTKSVQQRAPGNKAFELSHEDAYDYAVDEAPRAAVAFMANLTGTYTGEGTSNDTDFHSEVHTHNNHFFENVNHQVTQVMHQEEQLDSDVDLDINDYDNIIPYCHTPPRRKREV
nr:zinc finger, CCHC-type [Tanacetum cinerariifolium]